MGRGDGNQRLGDYIKSRRLSVGLSLSEAGEASGLDPSYWNKLENGHYQKPAPQHLQTIADVLGEEFEDLYEEAGYAAPKRLPSFQPYMRAKYDLPPEAVAQLESYFEYLNQYGVPKDQPVFPPKPKAQADDDETSQGEVSCSPGLPAISDFGNYGPATSPRMHSCHLRESEGRRGDQVRTLAVSSAPSSNSK